jgi:hypothetical protein
LRFSSKSHSLASPFSQKNEGAEDKERMVRFDEEDPSGAAFGLRDRDGESAASAVE